METDRSLITARGAAPWRRALAWLLIAAIALSGCATPSRDGPVAGKDHYATVTGVALDDRAAPSADVAVAGLWRDNAWTAIKPGLALRRGDVVQTGARGALVIAYSSGSLLYVGANTRGRIGSFTELVGRVFVKVKGFFEIETTFVKAGAKGTAYEVVSTADGGARVVVVDGIVELSSRNAAWPAVALGAGTRAVAHPQPPVPAQASAAELQSIESWVRPLEQLPARADAGSTAKAVAVAVGIAAIVAIILGSRNDDKKRTTPSTPGTPAGATTGTTTQDRPPPPPKQGSIVR
jgi:hypothetical protein